MYLQNHFRLDALAVEALVDVHHGNLDDVGSRSLYRSIDGVALGKVANGGVVRCDVGQIAAQEEQCCVFARHVEVEAFFSDAHVAIDHGVAHASLVDIGFQV